ncbi:MAG: hypothetical protein OHK0044_09770 [Burkholderiaceae bacterium]
MRVTIARGVAHFSYAPLLALAAAISFGKLIVYAALIEVAQFGALGKMLLVSTLFGMVGGLGLYLVASRDLPALLVAGRERRALALLAQGAWVTTLTAVAGLACALLGFELFDLSPRELMLGLLHGWVQQLFMFAGFDNRSRLALMDYARDLFVRAFLCATAGAAAATAQFGAAGVIVAETVVTALLGAWMVQGVLCRAKARWRWLPGLALRRLGALPWRASLVLLAGSLAAFASFNLDRWLAAEVLSREAFGQYAFAWIALLAAQSVQTLVNSGLLPLLARRAATGQAGGAVRLTLLMSAALLVAATLAGAASWLAAAYAVERWLPKYAAALPILPLLVAAAILRVSDFWSSLLVVQKREDELLAVQSGSVVVSVLGLGTWVWVTGEPPTGPALASLALLTASFSLFGSAVMALRRPKA